MAEKKVIAVVGATGVQGGGLVRAIQRNPSGGFRARALTRDVNSPKATALAALGAEVGEADMDDPESLKRGFRGAHGADCVTFYWAHASPERDETNARSPAQAATSAYLFGMGPKPQPDGTPRALNPELQTFDQWRVDHTAQVPLT